MKKFIFIGIIIVSSLVLASCATAPVQIGGYTPYPQMPIPPRQDVIHIVAPGETLWRISKMYGVNSKDIIRANAITNPNLLNKGQSLLVPDAAPITPVVTLYPSKKWKYIIIHHSATDVGNALHFDKSHYSRGWKGLGYHFVIDNGTREKEDGQIEVSPRWLKQQDGSHCQAAGMNRNAIGICLVGNFNKEHVSRKQMDSLAWLVNRLRRYYKIPLKNIMGHGQVPGARTACPGRNFSWYEFRNQLTTRTASK